ncbi:MAG: hypothetical protein ACXWUX_04935 [Allosphingosinicella sp.]
MKSWPNKALLLVGVASLGVALPAFSQDQDAPESLLPPGFDDPQTLPPPEEKAPSTLQARPERPRPAVSPATQETPGEEGEEELETLDPLEQARPINYFTIPEGTARPVDMVGPLEPGNFGLGPAAFGRTNGVMLVTLMKRLDAPLPSRWSSILLRRALLSRVAAPPLVHPVDWVAERADLLLRMGEADAARMLVQSVDQENYTRRMIEVAARTALATSDPAALCPLIGPANSSQTVWKLADAMCAALEGEPARASTLVDDARRRGDIGGIDMALTEKVIGAGAEARRAASLQWEPVAALTPWRLGLAGATGAEIPERLTRSATPAMRAWYARAPMVPLERRLEAAATAASLGILSSNSLVEMHSLMLDRTDPAEAAGTIGSRLRLAWAGRDAGERLEAMRSLWREGESGHGRHARLILTAGAASHIAPSADHDSDAANLIASMLTAGLDTAAAHWSAVVEESGDDRAWALLATASLRPTVELGSARIDTFIENDDSPGKRRAQLLVAALAGLGRLESSEASRYAGSLGVALGRSDHWSTALDRATRAREPGTVALLAAIGMQTGDWHGVPPENLFRIVRALRAVGMDYEARMIAAEAIARL